MGEKRDEVTEELRRLRDEARAGARSVAGHDARATPVPLPPPAGPATPVAPHAEGPAEAPPALPDATAVNEAWRVEAVPARGLSGLAGRLLERLLGPRFEGQQAFNSRQVQLDNAVLEYLEKRSALTHRHYDRLLGELGRRLDEADERHALLEKELVGHVQDLVRRIDLVLADGGRGRLSMEFALEEVRERLARLERSVRRRE